MAIKTLGFVQPLVLTATDGSVTPDPGEDGVVAWSTSGYLMYWNTTSWVRIGAAAALNKTSATVTLQDEPQTVVVPAAWVGPTTDFAFSFSNPDPYPDELLLANLRATVESVSAGVSVTIRVANDDGITGDVTMHVYQR